MRLRLLLLLGALHVAAAALGWAALRGVPLAILGLQAALLLSILASVRIVRSIAEPLRLARAAAELLREGDFSVRLARTGHPEVDALADVYNRMADRLRHERSRLVEQDLFLERLLEASPAGVVSLDLDGRVRFVSPSAEALLGRTAAELAGRRLDEGPEPLASLHALPDGSTRLIERDGRTLRLRRARFHDRGFPRSFFVIEELTDELAASERRAYDRVVQVMAHEVRNSVGVVRSLLDSVAAMPGAPSPRADFDEALAIATRRLLALNAFMNAVADVVRLPPPVRAPCDAGALVRTACAATRAAARERGVTVAEDVAAGVPCELDASQFEQAVLNVLRNAVEATPPGGTVRVTLREEGGVLVLRVRDQGPGIAPRDQARLFTPFFSTKPGGRGVGLMLVREVLQRHGFAHALATHPEGGAEMTVRLTSPGGR